MKKKFIMLIVIVTCVYAKENKYTFLGEYSYYDVLTILAAPSSRSVIGDSTILKAVRLFDISNKKFSVAVEQIKKQLKNENIELILTNEEINLKPIYKEKEPVYEVYMPYQKRWLVTEEKQDYLNAIQLDKEKKILDSIASKKDRSTYVYENKLKVYGFIVDTMNESGVNIEEFLKINVGLGKRFSLKEIAIGLDIKYDKHDVRYNFEREVKYYSLKDSLYKLNFGSENRRTSSTYSNNNVITEEYETYYDGLTVSGINETYNLVYRIEDNQVTLKGISDSLIYGVSAVKKTEKNRRFLFIKREKINKTNFMLMALLTQKKIKLKD